MTDILSLAQYIYNEYKRIQGNYIDEMKLHKLLYFAQRESFIQYDKPLFQETFRGWKYGPVSLEVREAYKEKDFKKDKYKDGAEKIAKDLEISSIVKRIIEEYANKDSWTLGNITHIAISWTKSRKGIPDGENGDVVMETEDIRLDAIAVKERQEVIQKNVKFIKEFPIMQNHASPIIPLDILDDEYKISLDIEKEQKRYNKKFGELFLEKRGEKSNRYETGKINS